jgi:hypothetical protein
MLLFNVTSQEGLCHFEGFFYGSGEILNKEEKGE